MQNYPMTNYYGGIPQNNAYSPMNNRYSRNQGYVIVNLVSNIKEAEAAQPDPLGNPTFFYNMAQNELYMKQFNNMGAAPLYIYKCSGEYTPQDNSTPVIMDYDKHFNELSGKIDNMTALLAQNMQQNMQYQPQQENIPQQIKQQGGRNAK